MNCVKIKLYFSHFTKEKGECANVKSLNEIIEKTKTLSDRVMAVVKAEDEEVLRAVKFAQEQMPVSSILIGSKEAGD